MKRQFSKLAVAVAGLAVAGVVAAACSSGGGGSTPTNTVVLKGNGSAANFACNHTAYLPASLGKTVQTIVKVGDQGTDPTSTKPLGGTRVAVFSPLSGTTSATIAAVVTTGGGEATFQGLTDNTPVSYKLTHAPAAQTYEETFEFGHFTSSTANQATRVENLRILEVSAYTLLGSIANGSTAIPPQYLTVAAQVSDCDGDVIQNATIQLGGTAAGSCAASGHTYPCVTYFAGGLPNTGATATDASGLFIVVGLTTGQTVAIQSMGFVSSSAASAVQLGELDVNGPTDGVPSKTAFGGTAPCTKPAPSCLQ